MSESVVTMLLIAIVVLIIVVALIVRWFLKSFQAQQKAILLKDQAKQTLSVKLQAYERMVLLIERLSPESLIVREQQTGVTASEFHAHLLRAVRQEFEHNMAMQIYLPFETWEKVQQVRDELIRLINTSAAQIVPNAPSLELGRVILEQSSSMNSCSKHAVNALRSDLKIYW